METIRQALERASVGEHIGPGEIQANNGLLQQRPPAVDAPQHREVALNNAGLLANRIISHIVTDPRSRPFDILRTQVLQSMDANNWKILGITSPTPDCGKTVTALNLAFSIARQPDRSVLLIDLDLQKPKVASILDLQLPEGGTLGVLNGRATLAQAVTHARIGDQRLSVLGTESTTGSSELIVSRGMSVMMQELKRSHQSQTIIIDLPPILTSDDVIAMLPQMDCILLVTAVGVSTVAQIEEAGRHLRSAEVVRVVLNKVPEEAMKYRYY